MDYKIIQIDNKVRLLEYNSITKGIYFVLQLKNCYNDWVIPKIVQSQNNITTFSREKGIELFEYYKNIY